MALAYISSNRMTRISCPRSLKSIPSTTTFLSRSVYLTVSLFLDLYVYAFLCVFVLLRTHVYILVWKEYLRSICWQSESITTTEKKLEEMKIEYVKRRVKDSGTYVDQLFFHDPDGYMIEICDCDNLPVIPLAPGDIVQSNVQQHQTIQYTGQRMQQQQVTCLTSIHMKEDNLLFV